MGAFVYPKKRSNKIKFNAKDFAHIKKALGQLIAAEEMCFFEVNGDGDGLTAKQRRIISGYHTTLKKLSHLRKKKT